VAPPANILFYLKKAATGVNLDVAQSLGFKVIHALSLPGKVAPKTAGNIIGETILNILQEMEVKP